MPKPVVPVANPREFIFETLIASFPLAQTVLDADKAAVAGREVYDDGYFTMFFGKVRPILERRLADSITGSASMITAAWIEAGRPALPLGTAAHAAKGPPLVRMLVSADLGCRRATRRASRRSIGLQHQQRRQRDPGGDEREVIRPAARRHADRGIHPHRRRGGQALDAGRRCA